MKGQCVRAIDYMYETVAKFKAKDKGAKSIEICEFRMEIHYELILYPKGFVVSGVRQGRRSRRVWGVHGRLWCRTVSGHEKWPKKKEEEEKIGFIQLKETKFKQK